MSAFNEVALFEQNAPTGSFYSSGSAISVGETPGSFSGPLRDKAQIRLSFKVKNPVKMLANSSSIYYFSPEFGQWMIPSKSISDIDGPMTKAAITTISWNPVSGVVGTGGTIGTYINEGEKKCFDAKGRPTASGSLEIFRQSAYPIFNQSMEGIGFLYDKNFINSEKVKYLVQDYPKSFQRNDIYDATSSEIIEALEVKEPFLIEKAVFEIPFSMGQSWFQDVTTLGGVEMSGTYGGLASKPWNSSNIDFGGPGITLSLFCQKKYGNSTIRDLIMSGTITHAGDATRFHKVRGIFDTGVSFRQVALQDFGFGKNASVVVEKNAGGQYTGSIRIELQSSLSNGYASIVSIFRRIVKDSTPGLYPHYMTPEEFISYYDYMFSTSAVPIESIKSSNSALVNVEVFYHRSIDAFGRGMTGFAPSGGSIFGGEYSTSSNEGLVENPLYIEDQTLRSEMFQLLSSSLNNAILAGPAGTLTRPFPVSELAWFGHSFDMNIFSGNKPSPYLLNPGESLVLALSKTRPAVSKSISDVPNSAWPGGGGYNYADVGAHLVRSITYVTGSPSGHDVTLQTGSINITLYGSYVRGGDSYIP